MGSDRQGGMRGAGWRTVQFHEVSRTWYASKMAADRLGPVKDSFSFFLILSAGLATEV